MPFAHPQKPYFNLTEVIRWKQNKKRLSVLGVLGEALVAYGAVLRGVIRQFGGVLVGFAHQHGAKFVSTSVT